MYFERTHRRVHELNLTALIDIVFHLMVFVMLTTSFVVSESMELSLPSGKASAPAGAQVMRLELRSDATILSDGRILTLSQLNEVLAARLAVSPETKVAVFTTSGVSVQQLVDVLDGVYLSGGRNVQVDKVRE
jgi:biopolymer transport protein ExbD